MVDRDLEMIFLREIILTALSLGLKSPQHYKNSPFATELLLFCSLGAYYLIIFFYAKITDPAVREYMRFVNNNVMELLGFNESDFDV